MAKTPAQVQADRDAEQAAPPATAYPSAVTHPSVSPVHPTGIAPKEPPRAAQQPSMPPAGSTASTAPIISGISPSTGSVGTRVTVTGKRFGSAQGSGRITLSDVDAHVTSWSEESITFTVPVVHVPAPPVHYTPTGDVVVTVNGLRSGTASFKIV